MADLPKTISFKVPMWLWEKLKEVSKVQGRSVGNLVRFELESKYGQPGGKDA